MGWISPEPISVRPAATSGVKDIFIISVGSHRLTQDNWHSLLYVPIVSLYYPEYTAILAHEFFETKMRDFYILQSSWHFIGYL